MPRRQPMKSVRGIFERPKSLVFGGLTITQRESSTERRLGLDPMQLTSTASEKRTSSEDASYRI
jgi:hypothetical protein